MARWIMAALHLLALGIGLGAIWARAGRLRDLSRGGPLRPVFTADNWWILALTLWLVTGLVRAVAGLDKPGAYYLHSHLFWIKMTVAGALFLLELWPMTALIQWGLWTRAGRSFSPATTARRLAAISYAQAALIPVLVLLATAMARGV